MKFKNYIPFLSLLFVFFYSCTENQCNTDTESLLRSEILVKDAALTNLKYLDSLSIYSPQWTDSIHYLTEGVAAEKSLYFMLSPTSDTTEMIFSSKQAPLKDTVYIYYQRELFFLSTECGFVTNYTIDTILHTNNYIDSLEVIINEITINNNGHIQIYF